MKTIDQSIGSTQETKKPRKAGVFTAATLAVMLALTGCTASEDKTPPEPTPIIETAPSPDNIENLDIKSVVAEAQSHALTPTLAGMNGSHHPLDAFMYSNSYDRSLPQGVFDMGVIALKQSDFESKEDFNSATAVEMFLNDSDAADYISKVRLPEGKLYADENEDGDLDLRNVDLSLLVNKKLQAEINKELSDPINPNNSKGSTLFSITGIDFNENGTIDSIVATPIPGYTIDFDSKNKDVYMALEKGQTLWNQLGMPITRLDGSSINDEYIKRLLEINPDVSSVDSVQIGQPVKFPIFYGISSGG